MSPRGDLLPDRLRYPAGAGEPAPILRRLVHLFLRQLRNVDPAAVEERLQFLKCEHTVDIGRNALFFRLRLLRRTRADEDDLRLRLLLLDTPAERCHRREAMGKILLELGKIHLHIAHERRTAGAHEESFFQQLLSLLLGDQIGAKRRLRHPIKPQRAEAGVNLPRPGIGKLAHNRRGDHGVEPACADLILD
ncbi:hypothetical protein SDC9_111210 [bioreactor metagenome]|uniref:Uncharacterized protein n=1 Tax=bioreactor metagenome TaxID=1076179 RepID=A0A645BR73_9ZZZZ